MESESALSRSLKILRDHEGDMGLYEFHYLIVRATPRILGFGVEAEDITDAAEAFRFVVVDRSKGRITLLPSGREYLA